MKPAKKEPPPVTPVTKVRRPQDITLPDEALLADVFAALTEQGAVQFKDEVLAALAKSKATNDFRPMQDVVAAWYRTLLFIQRDQFRTAAQEAIDDGEIDPDQVVTLEQARELLGA